MIRLLPITTAQTITIIPRDYSSIEDVYAIIVEDGTWETEEVGPLNGVLTANGNFVVFQPAFSILKNESIYTITFRIDYVANEFRDNVLSDDGILESYECLSDYLEGLGEGEGLLYRDKIYCSDQTNDEVAHTLNDGLYNQFEGDTDNKYIVLE